MNVSVILWDAGFRDRYHTLDCLANQTYPDENYEVVWVDYYGDIPAEVTDATERHENIRLLGVDGSFPWHAGRCVNEGIRQTDGELVIVLDGDVVVRPEFLETVVETHQSDEELSVHFHRWDEQDRHHGSLEWDELKTHCELDNPENYGGGLAVRRRWIDEVAGCDSHPRFQRASAVFRDLHERLLNLGLSHEWHPTEILLHPWHPGTGSIAEHARYRHQHRTIEKRKQNSVTEPDMSCLSEDGFDASWWSLHASLYYYYSLTEAQLYHKLVKIPSRGTRKLYNAILGVDQSN